MNTIALWAIILAGILILASVTSSITVDLRTTDALNNQIILSNEKAKEDLYSYLNGSTVVFDSKNNTIDVVKVLTVNKQTKQILGIKDIKLTVNEYELVKEPLNTLTDFINLIDNKNYTLFFVTSNGNVFELQDPPLPSSSSVDNDICSNAINNNGYKGIGGTLKLVSMGCAVSIDFNTEYSAVIPNIYYEEGDTITNDYVRVYFYEPDYSYAIVNFGKHDGVFKLSYIKSDYAQLLVLQSDRDLIDNGILYKGVILTNTAWINQSKYNCPTLYSSTGYYPQSYYYFCERYTPYNNVTTPQIAVSYNMSTYRQSSYYKFTYFLGTTILQLQNGQVYQTISDQSGYNQLNVYYSNRNPLYISDWICDQPTSFGCYSWRYVSYPVCNTNEVCLVTYSNYNYWWNAVNYTRKILDGQVNLVENANISILYTDTSSASSGKKVLNLDPNKNLYVVLYNPVVLKHTFDSQRGGTVTADCNSITTTISFGIKEVYCTPPAHSKSSHMVASVFLQKVQ